jgi:hypothetical protein
MDGGAFIIFIVSLILFLIALLIVLYNESMTPSLMPTTSTMIGAQCSVGCTCFPNPDATLPSDKPTQMCAYLSNDVMVKCNPECCQPTCVNQDVPNFKVRSTVL